MPPPDGAAAVGLPADVLGGESRPALGEELRQQVVAEVPDGLAQRYCPTGRNAAPDGEGQQRAAQHQGQGPPHGRADVDIGGSVPDVPAIEPGDQEIEAGQHPVAGGEALGAQSVPVGRQDGASQDIAGGCDGESARIRGRVLEVAGGGDIGQHQQRAGDHERVRGETVEEAGPVHFCAVGLPIWAEEGCAAHSARPVPRRNPAAVSDRAGSGRAAMSRRTRAVTAGTPQHLFWRAWAVLHLDMPLLRPDHSSRLSCRCRGPVHSEPVTGRGRCGHAQRGEIHDDIPG